MPGRGVNVTVSVARSVGEGVGGIVVGRTVRVAVFGAVEVPVGLRSIVGVAANCVAEAVGALVAVKDRVIVTVGDVLGLTGDRGGVIVAGGAVVGGGVKVAVADGLGWGLLVAVLVAVCVGAPGVNVGDKAGDKGRLQEEVRVAVALRVGVKVWDRVGEGLTEAGKVNVGDSIGRGVAVGEAVLVGVGELETCICVAVGVVVGELVGSGRVPTRTII